MMKMTKIEKYTLAKGYIEGAVCLDEEQKILLTSFFEHEISLLENKTAKRKPSKKQAENVGYRGKILEYLKTVDRATATEIFTGIMPDTSVQRVTALLTALKGTGEVVRMVEKGKTFFSLA